MTSYTPIHNNNFLLAAFLAFIPGHFPVAERLWTSWFKSHTPLAVHFWLKLFVIMLALLSINAVQISFVLFKQVLLKIICGLIIGYLFFILEFEISQYKDKINTSFELMYENGKNRFLATLLVLNAVCEEILFRKYLTEFVLLFSNQLLIFYVFLVISVSVFGLVHINFGIEKCFIKSGFAIALLTTVFLFRDITAAVIAHTIMNFLGLYCGKSFRLRQSYA